MSDLAALLAVAQWMDAHKIVSQERDQLRDEVERLKCQVDEQNIRIKALKQEAYDNIRAYERMRAGKEDDEIVKTEVAAAVKQERDRLRLLAFAAPFGSRTEHIMFEYLNGSEQRVASIIAAMEGLDVSEPQVPPPPPPPPPRLLKQGPL